MATTPNLTHEQWEQLRSALLQHDEQTSKIQIHDLNNPPQQPYRFKKFPMMVYDHRNSHPAHDVEEPRAFGVLELVHVPAKIAKRIVNSEAELEAALAEGFEQAPPPFSEGREESLSARYVAEANRVQEQINARKPRHRAEV